MSRRQAKRELASGGGVTPDVRSDPRGRDCACGRRLYPGQVCDCKVKPDDPAVRQ